jgi:6-phosphogluconolactonase
MRHSYAASFVALGVILAAAAAVAVASGAQAPSAAGRLVYIGTYTGQNTNSKGIYAFRFDERSGSLTPLGLQAETPSPSFLAFGKGAGVLYAVNELSNFGGERAGSVSSFAVDGSSGALTRLNVQSSKGADPCFLQCDATGRSLAVANYTGGTFAMFPVGTDGRLGPAATVTGAKGSGPDPVRQKGPHAHQVVFDPSNRYLLEVDLGVDQVLVYRFDQATGRISPNDSPSVHLAPGSGPRHLVFAPDGRHVFVIAEMASTITTLSWDGTKGVLRPLGTVSTLPAGYKGQSSTAEIEVHPNGRFLYGSNRGHDSIAVFNVDQSGTLTLVEHESTRGRTPRHFALDPSGRWLIAANQNSGTLAVFAVDQQTGALSPASSLVDVPSPVCVLFKP